MPPSLPSTNSSECGIRHGGKGRGRPASSLRHSQQRAIAEIERLHGKTLYGGDDHARLLESRADLARLPMNNSANRRRIIANSRP